MNNVMDLAKYIITKCKKDEKPISNLQLQKILYYIQTACLKQGTVAFKENIEAWKFGPVVPEVYYRFCSSGGMPILFSYDDVPEPEECKELIDNIIEEKRTKNAWDLVADTHKPGGAWDKTFKNGQGNGDIILREVMKSCG